MKEARSRLIVALDVPDRSAALSTVDALAGHVGIFKLGLEIFTAEGPSLVRDIVARGEKVFLDLKLHDIPNTVAGAVRSACKLRIDMLTLHAAGGTKMLKTAAEEARKFPAPPMLLAVTALTSLAPEDAEAIGLRLSLPAWVEQLATLALQAGIPGLVASAHELPQLHAKFGGKLNLVIPGIRPGGAQIHDQSRVSTPGDAIRAGASFLVVGRPILQAPDPAAAADQIVAEIASALSK